MRTTTLTAVAAMLVVPGVAMADPDDDTLVVNGEIEMVTKTEAPEHMSDTYVDTIMSGWHFRSDETQALQMDDFDNSGMVFVDIGREQWNTAAGSEDKSCATCHGTPEESMEGVRASYPKWDADAGEVQTLAMQVNDCRTGNMGAEPTATQAAKWPISRR